MSDNVLSAVNAGVPHLFPGRTVFLDIETTGLDPQRDAIIEIGAVAVVDDGVVARYHTLVQPGRPLTPVAIRLTGLSDADFHDAPLLPAIIEGLREFIGDSPVVAHHASFEASFFRSHRLPEPVHWWDSLVPAVLLRPELSRHNLDELIRLAGIRDVETHRALVDAEDTFNVLMFLGTHNAMSMDVLGIVTALLIPPHDGWKPFLRRC
ncbi:3'-5' exonuclease, partial [bacterium]|nr:3'-5' exonuclease [candidate division CSSED10-310 bacterium]